MAVGCLLKPVTAPDGEAGNLFLSVYQYLVRGHGCGVHGDADEIGICRQSLWLESRAGRKEKAAENPPPVGKMEKRLSVTIMTVDSASGLRVGFQIVAQVVKDVEIGNRSVES